MARNTPDLLGTALALAADQDGVLTRSQLLDRDVCPRAISRAVLARRLFPVFPGVYLVGRPEMSHRGLTRAALFVAGDHAVLSGRTAASVWGFIKHVNPVELSRPRRGASLNAMVRVAGERWWPHVTIHQSLDLPPQETAVKGGLRLTSPERSLLDSNTEHHRG